MTQIEQHDVGLVNGRSPDGSGLGTGLGARMNRATRTSRTSRRDIAPAVSVIVPIRNESENVEPLLTRLAKAVSEPAEVLFVDDSDDATGFRVRQLASLPVWSHVEISLIHRPVGLRHGGLGGAVAEGMQRARGEWVCVMDGDLQHPPEVIADLLAVGRRQSVDVVIATRCGDRAAEKGLGLLRTAVSNGCAQACRILFPKRFGMFSDPLSGFFLFRRAKVDASRLRPRGFKILLEILGRHPELTTTEVGYHFEPRQWGDSKVSLREAGRLAMQLAHLPFEAEKPEDERDPRFLYDVHGVVSVASDYDLPELCAFRVRALGGRPSLRIKGRCSGDERSRHLIGLDEMTARFKYRDRLLGRCGFGVEVEISDAIDVVVSPLVARSPHVLYTNVVEPILRWRLVQCGYALVHAACFVDRGRAYLITARTDTGKTTTMLKVLDEMPDVAFLSDDLVVISPSGWVLGYPKPLTISAHTLHAMTAGELSRAERIVLPLQSRIHSRAGRRFAFLLTSTRLPVASINAVVQILVPPPKYGVERMVPGVKVTDSAEIAEMFVIERSSEDSEHRLDAEAALETLLGNCADAFGFPPYAALEQLLLSATDEDLRQREKDIITRAFADVPTSVVRSSHMGWAKPIAARVRAAEPVVDVASRSVEPSDTNSHAVPANGGHLAHMLARPFPEEG